MCTAVRAQFMPIFYNFFGVFGVFLHPKLNGKKGAGNVVFLHDRQKGIGVIYPPSAVETDGNFFLLNLHRIDG